MKALLILNREDRENPKIEIDHQDNLWRHIEGWLSSKGLHESCINYVYYDNVLYKHLARPVLSDVMTGIEL